MPTVLAILPEGFEELEAIAPIDLLRRAGCAVTLAAVGPTRRVVGRNQIVVEADLLLEQRPVDAPPVNCILLPGGPGVKHMRASRTLRELLKHHADAGAWLAAICAAPLVLDDVGLLVGRRFTAHPSVSKELPACLDDKRVVRDRRLITSRGAGTAVEFGLELVSALVSPEKSAEIAASICV